MWVLMTRRRQCDYKAVFRHLKALFNTTGKTVISDFEHALRKALIQELGAKVQGCYFHYAQVRVVITFDIFRHFGRQS